METEGPNSYGDPTFDTPPFDEALNRFCRFIKFEGGSTDLFWVFREDVTTFRHTDWIRVPVPSENSKLAVASYELGQHQGLGITISSRCNVGGRSACFVWVPKDESEAARHL
jgi:hypothetical protein